jgi:hypothetical protein
VETSSRAVHANSYVKRGSRLDCKLARALGCKVRIPDLAAAAKEHDHTESTLAEKAQIAFDTVRPLLAHPPGGNVRSLEKLCVALGQPLQLVF